MDILGIDFTSRPSRRKPMTAVRCKLLERELSFQSLELWTDYTELEHFLSSPGPWIAGFDFPFGQSRTFVQNIGWPLSWPEYVNHVGTLNRAQYVAGLNHYRSTRVMGDREHRRLADIAASSISPQKLYGVPVGLMFFEGAQRLLQSEVTVPLLRIGDPNRVAVEAYPGVLARVLIGRRGYKNDTKRKQTEDQLSARCDMLEQILNGALMPLYGLTVKAPQTLADDPGADELDALLCAIQAAWAWMRRDENYGIPKHADSLEGWISDPNLLAKSPE